MTAEKSVNFQPFLGGFILETLTIGMYGESRNAIREYVQNGFDSIQRARELGLLKANQGHLDVELTADGLSIRDDGVGLSAKTAANTLTSVGASKKDYRTNAGFRGIGRLSGIVFSDRVTFTTKTKGEAEQTVVVFDGEMMREGMAPGVGGSRSAEELLKDCVSVHVEPSTEINRHFFEVRLDRLKDAPAECTDFHQMKAFLCQVAPVPYHTEFPFREEILKAAAEHNLPIDTVSLYLHESGKQPAAIYKPYGRNYSTEASRVELSGIEKKESSSGHWWAWIGKKRNSGAYTDPLVKGLRIRLKNIQVDGTEIMREIFQKQAPSYIRFQDWFIGEIFADPRYLVPNARRDGFEENANWKEMRTELGKLAQKLGRESYDVSSGAQLSIEALEKNLADIKKKFEQQKKGGFKNVDRLISLSEKITTYTKRIAQASQEADLATTARLQAVAAELTDIKSKCLAQVPADSQQMDVERIQQAARDELVKELMTVFEEKLSTRCASEVRGILREYLGQPEL